MDPQAFEDYLKEAKDLSAKLNANEPLIPALSKKDILELAHIFEPAAIEEELFANDLPSKPVLQPPREISPGNIRSPSKNIKTVLEEHSCSPENFMESHMNTGADLFSSPLRAEGPSAEALTQRLYPAETHPSTYTTEQALNELKRLAVADTKAEHQLYPQFGHGDDDSALEERIQQFKKIQDDYVRDYLEFSRQRSPLANQRLFILNGWSTPPKAPSEDSPSGFILTEEARKQTGGHYLRWNEKGIVINPGPGFLHNFHQQGLTVNDIDFVIITRNTPEAFADVKEIYALNNQLNKLNPGVQIIHYYLDQHSYQELSSTLKPNSKQARHTIHNLELFPDSPDVEKLELSEGITLNYFLGSSLEPFYKQGVKDDRCGAAVSTLGIRLELENPKGGSHHHPVRLGYISGTAWSPLLSHHLGHCDILLTGFGNTNPNDYSKRSYNEDCLGYHGTFSLLEEVSPQLLVCTEYGGREGDIRLETIKKIRYEFAQSSPYSERSLAVLPGDIGLAIDLQTLNVQCSVSHAFVDPQRIHVAKSLSAFGRLNYLSPECYL